MGSVVGERFKRAVDHCIETRAPLVCFSSSGGARMQEALFSLLQMAKTSAALARLAQARLPFISVLTDPTTGGVSASLAMLGDLNVAEPRALIGFAGPRVIQQTVRETLPEGFQRSEFLLDHGALDLIIDRRDMRERLGALLRLLMRQPAAGRAAAPAIAPVGLDACARSPSGSSSNRSHTPAPSISRLSRVREVARRLDLLTPAFRVITVGGTNGKGSTVAFLDALLRAAGLRCGPLHLAASGALQRAHLRRRRRGRATPSLIDSFERIDAARGDITLTFFEYNALAALDLFRQRERRCGGARSRARRPARRHQHHRCRRRRRLLHRPRSRRLARQLARRHRPREGRHLSRGPPRGAGQRRDAAHRVDAPSRKSARAPSSPGRDYSRRGVRTASAGISSSGAFALRDLPLPALAGVHQVGNAATALAALDVR